ncbi:MAG: hypothetical protein KGZ53_02520 [Peptococcaceae bacterium]|nr:hypothetical protein [Peptococcaceae bacterium]
MDRQQRALWVDKMLAEMDLARPTTYSLPSGRNSAWRVAPASVLLSPEQTEVIYGLGNVLRSFYSAADKLYYLGLSEPKYTFVPEYLDKGKPARLVAVSRHVRFKGVLPLIVRPDLLWTEGGFVATEFDSVPGGLGILAGMESLYCSLGDNVPNSTDAFAQAVKALHKSGIFAIVVSDECAGYRDEMSYLASELNKRGVKAHCLRPEQIEIRPDGLFYAEHRISTIYRFFELFDIDNVPNGWEMIEAATRGLVKMTPPPKAYLEEKLWFALIHHPVLKQYWEQSMGVKDFSRLRSLVPLTHVLDPRPVPPHAVIAGLYVREQAVNSYLELTNLPRGERSYVLKPSGFSPLAWGSRGVILGRELTTRAWGQQLERALASFEEQPFVLQQYYPSSTESQEFYDFTSGKLQVFTGKSRYCPYFFNIAKAVISGGMLVTTCPVDKPLIHGMTDAVMVPAILDPLGMQAQRS